MMKTKTFYKLGIDIGSTTLKVVVLKHEKIVYKAYLRHKANITKVFAQELNSILQQFPHAKFTVNITGSAGMGLSERMGLPFVQEVVASIEVIKKFYPQISTMIDLGGEDAKMVLFKDGKQPDIRMNGNCAGGTGAFIDQMADLMHISVAELGIQALKHNKLYPVASRCGVFAKTDVQNLISRRIPIPDIAMSILHTVTLQSITTLARGSAITPKILCIGGPLTFIPALRDAFKKVLKMHDADVILSENSEYFPAWGAALHVEENSAFLSADELIAKLGTTNTAQKEVLAPLFANEAAYNDWKKTRRIKPLKRRPLAESQKDDNQSGKNRRGESQTGGSIIGKKNVTCFLGIDSGSTTTKIVIMDDAENVIFTFYSGNEGNPLKKVVEGLSQFYAEAQKKNMQFHFSASAVTGYGEDLIKSALNLDYGIVETMAHLSGAQYVDPNVSFVLDIGGQDMKSIFTEQGVIAKIELNEACSSGCGSFLQNFASLMHMDFAKFTESACLAKYPTDLGSRCTVFMNSKVKQSLRENSTPGDIAAGLAYSVVKNCLFKVLKISNLNVLGDNIVVQGGAFRNDAVYRALELLSGKAVSSTDAPELMGALGAALYSQKMWLAHKPKTAFTGVEDLPGAHNINTRELQCAGCTNNCPVLCFTFNNGNTCYSGNKCEKVFYNKSSTVRKKGYNAFDLKNKVLFGPTIQEKIEKEGGKGSAQVFCAEQGVAKADVSFCMEQGEKRKSNVPPAKQKTTIGIPRVLNMFENYPFWKTLLTECGFEVVLSPESSFSLYQQGVGSVMSDNICFPAKLVHGHILSLATSGVQRIFYPMVIKEEQELQSTTNSFNCPVVSGYPDVIRSSIDPAENFAIPFDKPVVTFCTKQALKKACSAYVLPFGVTKAVFSNAFAKALHEKKRVSLLLQKEQKEILNKALATNEMLFVVAGRPYHADSLIQQKIGQILSDFGVHVVTDDVFRTKDSADFSELSLVSQWSYPNRVVQAALHVAKLPKNIQLVQLNSFGCGPDSFFMDEISEILKGAGKNHTVLRIDEIASPGSIRLRLRSFIESLKVTLPVKKIETPLDTGYTGFTRAYTKKDKNKTILAPWFADFISPFIPAVGALAGYKIVNLPKPSRASVETGLMYGHNEVCYPATLIVGDVIRALQSGDYDENEVVVGITQTGGQCRATNYLVQIKNALESAGFAHIPVLVLGIGGALQNEQEGLNIPVRKIMNITVYTLLYADALQQMYNSTSAREIHKGTAQHLFDVYVEKGIECIQQNNHKRLCKTLEQAVVDFNDVEIHKSSLTKIALVGEIYVKYNNFGQAHIAEWLRENNMEVVVPPILGFIMQYFVNSRVNFTNGLLKKNLVQSCLNALFERYMTTRIKNVENVIKEYRFYTPSESIHTKAKYASTILDLSNQFGEGWAIAAEVADYARMGINRIVCIQPFGCIANHIVAKGIEKRLKKFYPDLNLLYVDVDGGMAEVHLQNRLHFLMH